MRRSIFAALAACLTAAALPVVAGANHQPNHPASPESLSISARPNVTIFQNSSVISGKLTGQNTGDRKVTLEEDAHPFTSVNGRVDTQTDANGNYSFTVRPIKDTRYQVVRNNVRSAVVLVGVRIRMSLNVSDRTPRRGQIIRVSGRACPAHVGLPVRIQRKSATGFRTVHSTTLRASSGCTVYSRRFRINADGIFRVTADDDNHARGFSRSVFIDTHR